MREAKRKTRRFAGPQTGRPEEHWNFAKCPHPEQTRACYLYEYSLESRAVVAVVEAYREKRVLRESPAIRQRIAEFWAATPPPPPSSFAENQKVQEWQRKLHAAIPEADVTTKLNFDLFFLIDCEYFPGKHWLELPFAERSWIARQFHPHPSRSGSLLDPAVLATRLEANPLSIESFQEWLCGPCPLLTVEGYYVFSVNWERSNRKLIEDFKHWLVKTRPKDRPPFHLTQGSTSRRTTERELLKKLSVMRLSRHFGGNTACAKEHCYQETGIFLYRDEAAWKKAEKAALSEIERFDKLAE